MTRGRLGAPDARRFSVYRNNVAVGLIGALEARYPVSRRIAGDDLFRAMARAFVRARKPRSPVMIAYGEDFPDFVAAWTGATPCLADVARLENAWVEAYHAEDAGRGDGRRPRPIASRSCAGGPDRVSSRRAPAALFDPGRVALGLGPRLGGPIAPVGTKAEDALITRPDADVRVRVLPPLGYDFALKLREGATLIEAALALNDPAFDFGTHLVGLVESGAVASIIPGSPS